MRRALIVASVFACLAVPTLAADDPDEASLKAAGVQNDTQALIDFIRLRSRDAIPAEEIAPFLTDLAAADAKVADANGS